MKNGDRHNHPLCQSNSRDWLPTPKIATFHISAASQVSSNGIEMKFRRNKFFCCHFCSYFLYGLQVSEENSGTTEFLATKIRLKVTQQDYLVVDYHSKKRAPVLAKFDVQEMRTHMRRRSFARCHLSGSRETEAGHTWTDALFGPARLLRLGLTHQLKKKQCWTPPFLGVSCYEY